VVKYEIHDESSNIISLTNTFHFIQKVDYCTQALHHDCPSSKLFSHNFNISFGALQAFNYNFFGLSLIVHMAFVPFPFHTLNFLIMCNSFSKFTNQYVSLLFQNGG
jgi:hypothetical protein